MPKKRCGIGTRKCVTGKCVKKRTGKGRRCANGTRKCADRKCHRTRISSGKQPKSLTPSKSLTSPKDQIDHFNKFQKEFDLTMNGDGFQMTNRDQDVCAQVTIKSKTHLYLDNLYKCGVFSGTKVINTVESFAKKYGYRTIELEDDSRIESAKTRFRKKGGRCMIWVPILQILATGETWYNKLGYKSKFYAQEVAHNKKIIEKPFITLIMDIANQIQYSKEWSEEELPTLEELICGRSHVVDKEDLSITVKEVFAKVSKHIRNKELHCDAGHPDIEWILDILFFITDGHAVQGSMKKANSKNIIYLRSEHITQTKQLF